MKRELAVAMLKSMKEVEAALGRLEESVSDDHFDFTPKRDHLAAFRMGRILGSLELARDGVMQAIQYFGSVYDLDYDEIKATQPALHFVKENGNGK